MNLLDDDIIIHPAKTSKDRDIPDYGILLVNPGEANRVVRSIISNDGRRHFMHNSQLVAVRSGECFVAGPAIGAPAAALVFEKLTVLGAKKIILMGWCGAIDPDYAIGDVVIPERAVSGEGTSQYYSGDVQPGPSQSSRKKLVAAFAQHFQQIKGGAIWSTDAPYRESRRFLEQVRRGQGVVGVDMEFSALCSVADYRKVDFNAVMVVSDELWGDSWRPGFSIDVFKKTCNRVIEILLSLKE